jgi:hypothetical protein
LYDIKLCERKNNKIASPAVKIQEGAMTVDPHMKLPFLHVRGFGYRIIIIRKIGNSSATRKT